MWAVIAVKAQGNHIDKITSSYMGVKNALAASNSRLAKTRAIDLLGQLSVTPKELQPAQQRVYSGIAAKLKGDTRDLIYTASLNMQRARFQSLSNDMYTLLSTLKLNTTTVYQQYCPMKKAYWLSESEEIRNPYYGEKMLECGTVSATLEAAK